MSPGERGTAGRVDTPGMAWGRGQRHDRGRMEATGFPGFQDGGQASILKGHKGTQSQGCNPQGACGPRRGVQSRCRMLGVGGAAGTAAPTWSCCFVLFLNSDSKPLVPPHTVGQLLRNSKAGRNQLSLGSVFSNLTCQEVHVLGGNCTGELK